MTRLRARSSWALRWGGLVTAVVIVAMFTYSIEGFFAVHWPRSEGGLGKFVLDTGAIRISLFRAKALDEDGWDVVVGNGHSGIIWTPYFWSDTLASSRATIPFWVPFLLVSTPTGLAWGRWFLARRRAKRGLCCGCSYDLAGNTTGVCPECGKAAAQ